MATTRIAVAALDARRDSWRCRHSWKNSTAVHAPNSEHARCEVSGLASPRDAGDIVVATASSARPGKWTAEVSSGYVE